MVKLKELLKGKLTKKQLELVPSSFDMIGDLGVFSDFPDELRSKEKLIGDSLLKLNSHLKVVLKKTKKYSGKYRTPKLEVIAGERRKETELRENNVRLKLNPEKTYFSVRSSTERERINKLVKSGESVLVMFSGVGPFSIGIAKNTNCKEVYSVEINPNACEYQKENILLNKISNIKLFKGDVNSVVPGLKKKFDRVLMPLPRSAEDYLSVALKAAKKKGVVHFYDFLHENEFDRAKEKIALACGKLKNKYKILRLIKCGHFGPGIYRICVDFRIL